MGIQPLDDEDRKAVERVLGYLNFSSGPSDPHFLSGLNRVFQLAMSGSGQTPPWRSALGVLERELDRLSEQSTAFRDADQAAAVLHAVHANVLPGYLEFHRDLLFHRSEASLFNSFFVGRACEAVLLCGPPWDDVQRVRREAIGHLNDYIGYRPVATLESQKIEPYAHEWVRPIPLYVRDAGAAVGPYREVVERALGLLVQTDDDILREAYFDPDRLDELAVDPRAYDFDHPVNKRPNYHFGQWDPHHIDNRGYYRRYVVQQVTLDALISRLQAASELPQEEVLLEAAAVLAGTIIMATGISGAGPDSHDSSVTLATLLPRIAAYRDAFYERLLNRIGGRHARRLREEAAERKQPFGGARQHLNAELAARRAAQLEHLHLAAIFARMGYPEAASRQADIVPSASARMLCQIDCRLTEGDRAMNAGDVQRAIALLDEITDWLHRGIECGAIVDPWNMLGFDGHFSLFPALENSIHDHRVEELVDLMEQVFALFSRAWSEAAARDDLALAQRIADRFREAATWWRKYAAHEVSSLDATDVDEAYRAAELVGRALNLWHKNGAATDDVRFWSPHADMFDAPKAYALVVDALLERGDYVASMALLMHWLSQAERIGLEKGDTSFCDLAERWMFHLRCGRECRETADGGGDSWPLACKFLDRLEANAEEYWDAPKFELATASSSPPSEGLLRETAGEDREEDDEELYRAAYEDMVYRDSTDDGIDAELVEYGPASDDELTAASRHLAQHLAFLGMVARLWQSAATVPMSPQEAEGERGDAIRRWIGQATKNLARLRDLLDDVGAYPLPAPSGDHDSMVEYDRARLIKETILENVIATSVEMLDARRILCALASNQTPEADACRSTQELEEDELRIHAALASGLRGDADGVRKEWQDLLCALLDRPMLYVPLARGGSPREIVAVRGRQRAVHDLLVCLPRLGLIAETCQLIETAREMERLHPAGSGAVTEFDEIFKIGYKALVRTVIHSAPSWWPPDAPGGDEARRTTLVDCLKQLTESLLSSWLAHSKTLRLSVLEKAKNRRVWNRLVTFTQRYGAEIFTQRFLNLANLRAILYEGVDRWLDQLQEESPDEADWRLLDDLDRGTLRREEAVSQLSLILEAVVENYGEYRDYNSMTTQSDRGELLYMLLDFLRLRTQYDRICWQLKPVVWAHELLVRHGQDEAARVWREELAEKTCEQADQLIADLAKLQKRYAMRMPTVADRLAERFVRPMAIDRIRALVRPAIAQAPGDRPSTEFAALERETDALTRQPTGVGLDVPAWLVALEEEVTVALQPLPNNDRCSEIESLVPRRPLSLDEIRQQLEQWSSDSHPS